MSFSATAIVVLIASPSDTADERIAVHEALGKWNVSRGERESIVIVPWLYEQHAVPRLGAGPQSVINQQAVERADAVIAFFDARLGTETSDAVSGTAEEIIRSSDAGKPVHVYFSTEDVPRANLDTDQLAALQLFRGDLLTKGLLGDYSSPLDLAQKVLQAIDYDVSSTSWSASPSRVPVTPVRWRLSHQSGDTYLAENIGEGTAQSARISAFADLHILDGPEEPQDVPPGEALTFMAVLSMGTRDDRVLVSWNEESSGEGKTWKFPLPARPPR